MKRLAVVAGEEVAILADAATEPEIWRAFFSAALQRGAQPTVVLMSPRTANGLEPTVAATDAIQHANVVFAITGASATHTKALKKATMNGARVCSMPGIDLDIMLSEVMTPDYRKMRELGDRLAELLAPAMWMHVTTAKGTDLRVAMGGWSRMPMVDDGTFTAGTIANLPAGEVLIVPWEGSSEGRVVVDLAVSCYPDPLPDPVTIKFEGGRVTAIEGASEPARRIERLIQENGENAGNFAEMAIGINEHARNTGVLIETEKQFGTAHIGIGNSANIGGNVWAPIHIDVIFGAPTIAVDGRTILSEGEFVPDISRRESFKDATPTLDGAELAGVDTSERDGKLFRVWKDIQGVSRQSQVGDDETAGRAKQVRDSLERGSALSADDRRVAAVMRAYGLVR